MKILLEAPLNSLSFGNVSYNFIREFIEKDVDFGIFPMNQDVDLSAYDLDLNLKSRIEDAINNRYDYLNSSVPSLKIWHLNGAENRKNSNQYLYTFYECSEPTDVERKICNAQTETIFSSKYAGDQFSSPHAPLGFDKDFFETKKTYLSDVTHFGLFGKMEKRKHTAKIINTWAKKYGNNSKYQLSCLINNPFLEKEELINTINMALEGERYNNINLIPFLKKNDQVNELLNAIDIDLTGLSGGEGWNLPAFNATCLGKWSIVLNATSHKDWANEQNSILIEPSGTFECYDGRFFAKGRDFNQGVFFDWEQDQIISAMEEAEKKVGQINTDGQKLADKFTYSNTVDSILSHIS
ncbi:MAG: hypothetical protein HWN81_01995 [Candidatus Lokiarchaeota archaeon]|nr:hypothetical protein [Candidatus Lokiarchaeota archaeon]